MKIKEPKTLEEWKQKKRLLAKAYLECGLFSQTEHDRFVSRICNPPQWFLDKWAFKKEMDQGIREIQGVP